MPAPRQGALAKKRGRLGARAAWRDPRDVTQKLFRALQVAGTTSGVQRFEVMPLGDSALLVRMQSRERKDSEADVRFLLQARNSIEGAGIPGTLEVVTGYASVAVFFDPAAAESAGAPLDRISEWFATQLEGVLHSRSHTSTKPAARAGIEIPVCYDAEFAIDLDRIARHTGLAAGEVVRLHAEADYCVRCVGFTPGFPYLGGLPTELATPRRATPRTNVPAGAVAIGGDQAGIYPAASPGGWNVIGRTPLQLFDPRMEPPALLRGGDQVRFRAITRDEFAAAS